LLEFSEDGAEKHTSMKDIKRVVHISHNFVDAELWDIKQQVSLSPEERQKAAKELKSRAFGKAVRDVRARPKKR
jgi:adenylylsulfate kinase-like enzyme